MPMSRIRSLSAPLEEIGLNEPDGCQNLINAGAEAESRIADVKAKAKAGAE